MRLVRKRTLARWTLALLLGGAVAALSWWWRYAWLPPGVWEDVAVAAGLRPPEAPFPLLWHALAGQLFRWLDAARAIRVLLLAGHCALGVAAVFFFLILDALLPKVFRGRMQRMGWSRWIVRMLLVQGVLLFVCSDPVWEAGQVFGPTMMHLLLLLLAVLVFLRVAWARGVISGWYWTMAFLGMLGAETPLGILLAIGCLVVCRLRAESNADKWVNPMADPFVRTVTMRRMTLAAAAGWLVVAGGNTAFFCLSDGLEAHDMTGFLYAVSYLFQYAKVLGAAATPAGWMLFVIVVLVPLVLSMIHVGAATDDDKFLPYWYAVFFTMTGLVSFLQLAGWRSFWFWTWTGEQEAVRSLLMRCLCSLLNAQTAMYALCVLGVEVFFRNYRRIAGIKFQDSVEETALGADTASSFRRFDRWSRFFVRVEPLVLLALVVPYRAQPVSRAIMRTLYDCARQTAAECQDAKYLFTDGTMDTAVELCAREQGRNLLVLSMSSGGSDREQYIRRRGAEDEEDREMLAFSAVDALRTWLRLKSARMDGVALQLGFELWARGKMPPPPVAGLVARPAGFPEGLPESAAKEADALANRMLDIYNEDEELETTSPELRDMFVRIQWRLARMCRVRADKLDADKQTEAAVRESKLADELDKRNAAFKKIRQQLEMLGRSGSRLTPREGLKLGMDRADFRMAEMFARQVLVSDPDDLAANFVMGMYHFGNGQYGRAEVYLRKCLEQRPDEWTILNNLAVAQLRQGLLAEAEENARHAIRSNPDAREAKRTLENILKAKAEEDKKRREEALGR
ncbi:MAG: tetratricopeptide repeat protein [Kiritimatiellae bacterium]|nr:tetratricopeptide repeat protein [Kiritimatiellia bacterium]